MFLLTIDVMADVDVRCLVCRQMITFIFEMYGELYPKHHVVGVGTRIKQWLWWCVLPNSNHAMSVAEL